MTEQDIERAKEGLRRLKDGRVEIGRGVYEVYNFGRGEKDIKEFLTTALACLDAEEELYRLKTALTDGAGGVFMSVEQLNEAARIKTEKEEWRDLYERAWAKVQKLNADVEKLNHMLNKELAADVDYDLSHHPTYDELQADLAKAKYEITLLQDSKGMRDYFKRELARVNSITIDNIIGMFIAWAAKLPLCQCEVMAINFKPLAIDIVKRIQGKKP